MDVARVEAAIGEVESDPRAMEAVQAIVEMYGEGLARIVERVGAGALVDDELVAHLLLLHDLHPVPVEERVRAVLEEHGAAAELVSLDEGVARLKLDGRPLKPAVEDAIRKAAPDIDEIVVEGAPKPTLLQLPVAGQDPLEKCELCGAPIPAEHRHMLDLESRELMCACQACRILFDSGASGGGHYRLVPERRLRIADFSMDDVMWEELRIPVDMAFFFFRSDAARVVAYYPSPAGPTESLLELDAWEGLEGANPLLRELEPDVEALLVNRSRGARQYFLVPVEDCYALVGLIRSRWRGLAGGREVWEEIEAFFERLSARSKEAHSEREEATWGT